jgi:hypothetical protein
MRSRLAKLLQSIVIATRDTASKEEPAVLLLPVEKQVPRVVGNDKENLGMTKLNTLHSSQAERASIPDCPP